jgi:hypothetical protein
MLSYETVNFHQKADHTLFSLKPPYSDKWRRFPHLKMCFHTAYAYCYYGQTLLGNNKRSEAIKSLQEEEKYIQRQKNYAKNMEEPKDQDQESNLEDTCSLRSLRTL